MLSSFIGKLLVTIHFSPGYPEYFDPVLYTLSPFKVTVVDWIFGLVSIDDVYSFRCKKLKSEYL